ncbi:ribulokinase [Chitinophaga japonensis]|uniref:Ribulokinase n=1 Tax=Chitinophaga japonensis TaxID=104662 RepID=A0A562T6D3_CHIJA|nr:ribulokinase [Chitinophaga japonensis]TWI89097.1 L-ribulokinase [Chitinophaga japonensis]
MKTDAFVIGVDFGTDSVRALVVNAATGQEAGSAVYYYPRWKQGLYCDAARQQYRQHPLDYLEGLEQSIKGALQQCPAGTAALVRGISVDTTGSTPVAVDEQGTPLALLPGFEENPNAMFVLWKDHTSNEEAARINEVAHSNDTDYTKYCGGIYSSEWFWAKILHIVKTDAAVQEKAASWVEHCDWIPAVLTGNRQLSTLMRGRCSAGHKAMWHAGWGGLPPADFLEKLHPSLRKYDKMFTDTVVATEPAGPISPEWAAKLGIPGDTVIGTGAFDAHMGAVGAGIQPYVLCRVIGTSTCDITMGPLEEVGHLFVKGICGQVDGSVVPGMLGLEAGQSAYGDVYAWLRRLIMQPLYALMKDDTEKLAEVEHKLLGYLAEQAQQLPLKEQDPLVLDWFNGRRTPDANHTLKSAILGLHLGIDAVQLFRALVEATAFGARSIVERFVSEGVPIHEVLALGGVARKSGYAMQVLADVLDRPIKIVRSEHACALGAAMFAAVCAGIYPDIAAAQQAMSSGFDATWHPRPENVPYYAKRYQQFLELGAFTEKTLSA